MRGNPGLPYNKKHFQKYCVTSCLQVMRNRAQMFCSLKQFQCFVLRPTTSYLQAVLKRCRKVLQYFSICSLALES